MAFDAGVIAKKLAAIGTAITPETLEQSGAAFAPFHEAEPYRGVSIARDFAYGDHPRHKLDVFTPSEKTAGQKRPVLVFVHGGGFVGGDKRRPGTPYQDNVGVFAVRNGMIGVTLTYRLAPDHPWPAGAEDLAAALAWVRAHIAEQGGDPSRIYLMGTSAGAVHVASYVAHKQFHPKEGPGLAGAIFLSGIFDLETAEKNKLLKIYFGAEEAAYPARSSLPGLLETSVPLLFSVTEHDPFDFQNQALRVMNAWWERHQRLPDFVMLSGHNHYTSAMQLNTPDTALAAPLLRFIQRTT